MATNTDRAPMDDRGDFYEWWANRWLMWTIKFSVLCIGTVAALVATVVGATTMVICFIILASILAAELLAAIFWARRGRNHDPQ